MNDEARRIIACRVWSGIWAISSIAIVIFAFVLATFRGETLPEPIAPMTLPAKTVSQGI
jgi:hypothetical protein